MTSQIMLSALLSGCCRERRTTDAKPRLRSGGLTIAATRTFLTSTEANALVAREGIPFREAYRRIGEKYRK